MKKVILVVVFLLFSSTTQTLYAGLIQEGLTTSNGLGTFTETNTGRIWLDLDNFSQVAVEDMVTIAATAGFTFATRTDVESLLSTLPYTEVKWTNEYIPYMGSSPHTNGNLIWGAYDDETPLNPRYGYAYGYDPNQNEQTTWVYIDDGLLGGPHPHTELGLWAYKNVVSSHNPIPEPTTIALLGIGIVWLAGVALRRRFKRGRVA